MAFEFPSELVRAIARETVCEMRRQEEEAKQSLPDRLAFGEGEAARLLGLQRHQLRDARRRGEILCSVGPGRKILYTREDLTRYLMSRRWTPEMN